MSDVQIDDKMKVLIRKTITANKILRKEWLLVLEEIKAVKDWVWADYIPAVEIAMIENLDSLDKFYQDAKSGKAFEMNLSELDKVKLVIDDILLFRWFAPWHKEKFPLSERRRRNFGNLTNDIHKKTYKIVKFYDENFEG